MKHFIATITRFGMLEAFLIFIIFLYGINFTYDYYVNLSTAEKMGRQALTEAGREAKEELRAITDSATFLLNTAQLYYGAGTLDPDDTGAMNRLFMPYMRRYPYITSINYGDASGNGYLILREGSSWRNRIKQSIERDTVIWAKLTDHGEASSHRRSSDNYDPRLRPWYTEARDRRGIQWSEPYVFRTTRDLGLTASRRFEKNGVRGSVLGVDIMLKDLSRFLEGLTANWKDITIHVITPDRSVLASSEALAFDLLLQGDNPSLPHLLDEGFRELVSAFHPHREGGSAFFTYQSEGRTLFARIDAVRLSDGDDLFILLTIPRRTLLENFAWQSRTKFYLFLGLLAASSALFIFFYLLPLRRITTIVRKFSRGGPMTIPVSSRADEIGTLTSEFRSLDQELGRRQEALSDSERHYRLLFEDNPNPLWVIERETRRFLAMNAAAVKRYGYSREEFLSLTEHDILLPSLPPAIPGRDALPGPAWPQTVRHRAKNEDVIEAEITSRPITWAGADAEVALVHDVTARRQLEAQLRQAQKMEAVGQLAGGVAHDFNNILTAIIGYANLLEMKMSDEDPGRLNVEQILSASERAARLTHSLLAFSRKQIINPRPTDLNAVVRSVEKLLRRLIGEDIEFNVLHSPEPLVVLADAGQIEQVLMNLATNARDSMPRGGALSIETGFKEIDDGFIRAHGYGATGRYGVLYVSDTGEGMDAKTQKRIFDPFYTTKDVGKGTGLGLSIVYGIVKQHNGYVNVYSEPGRGTTFKIYLPLSDAAPQMQRRETQTMGLGGTETVLVAEDDTATRTITTMVLREFGYKVIEARDGAEAVRLFKEQKDRIDLVIIDVVMPTMNGKEAMDRIAAIRPDVKCLFMSGYTADIVHKKGVLDEGVPFISKPASPTELLKKIREILTS
ncbi:MAG: hypothetical protein A2X56_05605 [Nitrospirae bacterium GWC2_57_13]|nr:MAG: hypothetical protein A2072_03600 [Nitrospirae bacterium GWC1_57_7]OGW29894.1 MAG: hypothetical protein A2X56_05605 [Nitrospirae bacterium GWC2_57_13]